MGRVAAKHPALFMNSKRFYYDGANCRLSAVDFGSAGKPPVVLVHGMRDHALSLSDIAVALSNRYHVIAIDLRGHGHSDNPGAYAMTQFVADVRALMLFCQIKMPVLIGHSLGGHIVGRYAMAYPDDVARLVLLDGMGPPLESKPLEDYHRQLIWREQVESSLGVLSAQRAMVDHAEALQRLQRNNPRLKPKLAQLIVDEGVEAHAAGGIRWRWDPVMTMVWQTFSMIESEQQMRWFGCPVLIVTGDEALNYWVNTGLVTQVNESMYQSELARRMALFVNAQHVVIDQAGHMLHYDQPERLCQLLLEFCGSISL